MAFLLCAGRPTEFLRSEKTRIGNEIFRASATLQTEYQTLQAHQIYHEDRSAITCAQCGMLLLSRDKSAHDAAHRAVDRWTQNITAMENTIKAIDAELAKRN